MNHQDKVSGLHTQAILCTDTSLAFIMRAAMRRPEVPKFKIIWSDGWDIQGLPRQSSQDLIQLLREESRKEQPSYDHVAIQNLLGVGVEYVAAIDPSQRDKLTVFWGTDFGHRLDEVALYEKLGIKPTQHVVVGDMANWMIQLK